MAYSRAPDLSICIDARSVAYPGDNGVVWSTFAYHNMP